MTRDMASAAPSRPSSRAGAGTASLGGAAVHEVLSTRAGLADPGGDDQRRTLTRQVSVIRRYRQVPGYDSVITPTPRPSRTILKGHGYATRGSARTTTPGVVQYTVAGPFNQWPVGMGFGLFLSASWRKRQTSGRLIFSRTNKQIFPWMASPNYNLTTEWRTRRSDTEGA